MGVAPTTSTEVARTASPSRRTSARRQSDTATVEVTHEARETTVPATPRMLKSPEKGKSPEKETSYVPSPGIPGVDDDATLVIPTMHPVIQGGHRVYGPGGDVDDSQLKNAYDAVNLVRSDLIREFERRGEETVFLAKQLAALRESSATNERSRILAETESLKWREAIRELEKQRDVRSVELKKERFAAEAEAETAVRRGAALEAALATANAKLAAETAKAAKATATAERLENNGRTYGGGGSFGNEGALKKRLAESDDLLFEALAEAEEKTTLLREATLENERALLKTNELTRKLVDTETALADAEILVGEAELAVAFARREMDAAKAAAGPDGACGGETESKNNRIAELEAVVAALRSAASHDAALVERARLRNTSSANATASEERAFAALARATRAETRLGELELAAAAAENEARIASSETQAWRAALARVPGATTPASLVDAVVTLENSLAAALGQGGESSSRAAACAATAAAATRRSAEAERLRDEAKTRHDELLGALARLERRNDSLQREKDSLQRVVKSFDDEASKHFAGAGGPAGVSNAAAATSTVTPAKRVSPLGGQSPFSQKPETPETQRRAELDLSLRHAHERIASLEHDLELLAKERSESRLAANEKARVASETEQKRAAAETRIASLQKEVDALELRLMVELQEVVPQRNDEDASQRNDEDALLPVCTRLDRTDRRLVKVWHFKQNPEFAANETATRRELACVKSERDALRETVARLAAEANGGGAFSNTPGQLVGTFGNATPLPFGGLVTPARGGPAGVPTTGGFTTGGGGPSTFMTPNSSLALADAAELQIARRKIGDLEKRELRLMSAFKKQIYNFRETVTLLFGYKVDMAVDSVTGASTATLRSLFANGDDDKALRFAVTPAKPGVSKNEGTVTIIETDYSSTAEVKLMTHTFVDRCGSVPAFLANLTMELFNKSEQA